MKRSDQSGLGMQISMNIHLTLVYLLNTARNAIENARQGKLLIQFIDRYISILQDLKCV